MGAQTDIFKWKGSVRMELVWVKQKSLSVMRSGQTDHNDLKDKDILVR